ncbi:MAG TPA: hypothetical protein VH207_08405 [Chthoniobacterales bacterium]|jgi:hypothetical protein|nr:hypothetical protein [Chthoniobacterales bacterium]
MKTFLVLVLSVTALFVWQREGEKNAVANKPRSAMPSAATASPRPVSEHNWAKNSLDRARAMVNQVQQSRAGNEQP